MLTNYFSCYMLKKQIHPPSKKRIIHRKPDISARGPLGPGPLGTTRTLWPDHSDHFDVCFRQLGLRCILCSRTLLSATKPLFVGGPCYTCTNSVEELVVATGTVNWFLTRPNRGRTLLTIDFYDLEWHVLGLLCKILIKPGQATHACEK